VEPASLRWMETVCCETSSGLEGIKETTTYLVMVWWCWLVLAGGVATELSLLMLAVRLLPPAGHPIVVADGRGAFGGGGPW
jgi:hypothetical protein